MKTNKSSLAFVKPVIVDVKVDDLPYIFVTAFDDAAVSAFYKSFLSMQLNSTVNIVPIVISSFGGQVHSLLSMIDIIQASTKPVATIALGKAMSCGAVLLAAGTKGYRYAAPNTDIMLHEVSSMEWGKTTDLENNVKQCARLNAWIFKFLSKQAGNKDPKSFTKSIKELGNIDWYLSADEYQKMGLVDHVSVPQLGKE